ncbi:MAG: hypothetical protein A2802_01310 [Candidatus Woykebacteria bacterium RIFCSPHIGHO2_01_FULL_43_29]|uniref:HAD family hydrolase n=2 Tax=Candidatus Woykeibacteriota TaxID=1817899 RepID=A0A1G1WYP7_9BACT|nr:MAG: hypothetical protein A2802_01310 [Candidatus Woykebacteria bacterium RIFCSPHIGHO2_01_FULL_43_29]OGY29104.1 MAG: hypothetical protein A3J50_02355 [Candidatus Woykebacteria bacterium RIFCSPHIGHO2_02_FULL_43_16b]OGY32888.1 MAG: hypothetical protein A3A61_02620 [Candidatus Woykebacteria bacterium RIFCSPLOWO2_01_FULL_43_14]
MVIHQDLAQIKLVLFDLDDTLVHTYTDYELARREIKNYLVSLGLPQEVVIKPIILKIKESAKKLASNYAQQQQIETISLSIIEKVELEAVKNARVIEGSKPSLNYLRTKGLHVGIFSRTSSAAISKILAEADLGKFDIILGRNDLKEPKPDPEGILKSAKALGLKTNQIALVGDHPYDILSTKKVNSISIGVLTGVSDRQTLESVKSDYILESVLDLPKLFT